MKSYNPSQIGPESSLTKLEAQSADTSKYKRNQQLRSPKKVMNIQENLI